MKPQRQHQQIGTQHKFDILLVDDRTENLLALEAVLSDIGQNLLLKHLLRPNDFAVVVLDAHMPGMDGFETARQIRSRRSSQSLPIIFVTAVHQSDQYAMKAYSLGGVDYVYKPFDPEALKAKVRVFVELAQKSREVKIQAELLQLANQDLERRVRQRTAELEKANHELRLLFQQSPHPKWVCDLSNLSFLAVNEATTHSYGYTKGEFLRMTLRDLRPAEDIPELMEQVEQLRRGQPVEAVFRHRKKDGSFGGGHQRNSAPASRGSAAGERTAVSSNCGNHPGRNLAGRPPVADHLRQSRPVPDAGWMNGETLPEP
jgi:PAS domain S-box-containing protein